VTTVAIARCKDEVDVVEGWVRHHADEVDHVLIADNGSTDGTWDILRTLSLEFKDQLTVQRDPEVGYYQSRQMSALAAQAADMFGDDNLWICPIDLDELWIQPVDRIRTVLPTLGYPIALATLYNHVRTGDDVGDPDPFRSMVWRIEQPGALPKVAFRYAAGAQVHQGNHGVTLPTGETGGLQMLHIHHFPVRSAEHMIRKARNGAAAYAAAPDLDERMGAHWRSWGRMSDDQLREAFETHWSYTSPADVGRVRNDGAGLVRAPAPYMRWQVPETA
jgi:hypothetical protein